jgi:hypothetical protein
MSFILFSAFGCFFFFSGVLKLLEKQYGELDVRYDKNLLGGKMGWEKHAKPSKTMRTLVFLLLTFVFFS